jgi:hypothetical protein
MQVRNPASLLFTRAQVVRALEQAVGRGESTLAAFDTASGLRWRRIPKIDAAVSAQQLLNAVDKAPSSTGAAAIAQLANSIDAHAGFASIPDAAAWLAVQPTTDAVRGALAARGLDVVVQRTSTEAFRPLVPTSYLSSTSSVASLVGRTKTTHTGRGKAPLLVGGAVIAAGIGAGALYVRRGEDAVDAPVERRTERRTEQPASTSTPATSAPSTEQAPPAKRATPQPKIDRSPKAKRRAQREELVRIAYREAQAGHVDVNDDGTRGWRVAQYKRATRGAHAKDLSERWEAAFATWTSRKARVKIGTGGRGAATVLELSDWARRTGRIRSAKHEAVQGDLVLLKRRDGFGLTWHDVGVVVAREDGAYIVAAGNRMREDDTVRIDGKETYVGRVGLERIERDLNLEDDGREIEGVIDLVSKPLPVREQIPQSAAAARRQIVERAASQLGWKETSANAGPAVFRYWDDTGYSRMAPSDMAWCAAFVSWLYNEQRRPLVDTDGDVSTITITRWAKTHPRAWHDNWNEPRYAPKPGDVVLFKNDGNDASHIGIVDHYDRKTGIIHTIEGNVPAPDGSSGGTGVGVYRLQRRHNTRNDYGQKQITGFIDMFELPRRRG